MPNETPPELEAQFLAVTREYPTTSYVRIADQLKLIGVPATAKQVRGVWLRHGLVKAYDRLLWLEREAAATGGPLTERVAKLLALPAATADGSRAARGSTRAGLSRVRGHLLCGRSKG